jgi:hypothetical protein
MRARPLLLALLVALLGHALWLAHAQLRQRREPVPQALRSRDDSPELLVFSRLPPEPLTTAPFPLPPDSSLPPPPPPPLPSQSSPAAGAPPEAPGPTAGESPAQGSGKGSGKGRGRTPAAKTAAAKTAAARPAATKPADRKTATVSPVAVKTVATARAPQPAEPREEAATAPLRRLQEARRQGPVRLQGEKLQSWRSLWQAAEADASPPAALDPRGGEVELRRIPLARARADGLDPSHGEVLRLDDHLLLAWIEGSQLWLLRAPV